MTEQTDRDAADKPVFILGVGAQKGGTSWLHYYLNDLAFADFGFRKEYHIWDALDIPEGEMFRAKRLSLDKNKRKLRRMQDQPATYFSYFRSLTARPGIRMTGDITPSYSGLPESRLRFLRDNLVDAGFAVRTVFLMRDPVERCWSAARMERRNDPDLAARESEQDYLARIYRTPGYQFRTHYEDTMARLSAVFDPGEIYLGLFETMMQPENVAKVSEFLGVPDRPELVRNSVNASPKQTALDPELAGDIAAFYRPTYEACADAFPETKGLWGGWRTL